MKMIEICSILVKKKKKKILIAQENLDFINYYKKNNINNMTTS